MTAVQLGLIFTLAADVLLLVVFRHLWLQRREPHLLQFTLAWGAGALRFGLLLTGELVGRGPLLGVVMVAAVAAQAWFLLKGTLLFVQRPVPRSVGTAVLAVFATALALSAAGVERTFAILPLFLVLGAITIAAGLAILQSREDKRFARYLAGGAFLLWGLHRLNFPFLYDSQSFAPFGLLIASVLELGVAVGALLLYFDRATRAAEASEARYRSLVLGNLDGLFVTTPAGRFLEGNPALWRMLGYASREELLTVSLPDDVYVDPADRARLIRRESDQIDGVELDWKRKDGRPIRVELRGRVLRDARSEPIRFEGSVRDVTRERALAQELDHSRRLEALGRVAGGVAHDFNNLLTVILGSVDLLGRDDYQDAQRNIREAALRGAGLTQQLLAVGSKHAVRKELVELGGLVEEVAPLLRRLIGDHVQLQVERQTTAPMVGDREQLVQVLLNLGANARDAMPDGGPLLVQVGSGGELPEALRLSASDPGDWVWMRIKDEGSGMTAEVQEHLFEPFYTTKDFGKGTGLGLASVYGVVSQAGGHVEVASRVGVGSTFTLWFPRSFEGEQPLSSQASGQRVRGQRGCVLLVEDERAVRSVVESTLRTVGYVVRSYGSGREIETAIGRTPALLAEATLLLTDVLMPGATGPSVARSLREQRPDLPVLYMSGNPERCAELGPRACLPKPFRAEQLLGAVAAAHEEAAPGDSKTEVAEAG